MIFSSSQKLKITDFHPGIPRPLTVAANPVKTRLPSLWYWNNNSALPTSQESWKNQVRQWMNCSPKVSFFMTHIEVGESPFGCKWQKNKNNLTQTGLRKENVPTITKELGFTSFSYGLIPSVPRSLSISCLFSMLDFFLGSSWWPTIALNL